MPAGARASRPRRVLALVVAVAGIGVSLAASRARADAEKHAPSASVVLIDAEDDPLRERTIAELATLGLEVQTVDDARPLRLEADVDLIARTVGATTAISVDSIAHEVRVWVLDRALGHIVLRATVPVGSDAPVAALRAVEALRTLLNQPRAPIPPPIPSMPPPRAAPGPYGPARPPLHDTARLGISLGPALAGSAGGFGASLQALLAIHWLVHGRFGIEAMTLAPITVARWQEAEGAGALRLALAAPGAHLRAVTASWGIVDLGAGVSAALLHTQGTPSAGFSGQHDDALVAMPYVRAGVAIAIAPSWRLRWDLAALIAVPRPLLTFGDRTVGPWGWPLVLGSAGIEVVLR